MATARFNDTIIANSDDTVIVEGNHYFPRDAVDPAYLEPSDTVTTCTWKGQASYYTVVVDGQRAVDAAWYYPAPKRPAERVRDRIAFWRGVTVEP